MLLVIDILKTYWKPLLVCFLVCFFGWWMYSLGKIHVQAEWDLAKAEMLQKMQELREKAIDEANTKSAELEAAIAKQKELNRKLNGRLANEVKTNTAYGCAIPDNGLQLFNDSITQNNHSSKPCC